MSNLQTGNAPDVDHFLLSTLTTGSLLGNLRKVVDFADKLPCLSSGHRAHGFSRGRLAAISWLIRICVSATNEEIGG